MGGKMKLYLFRHGETFANKEILVADGYSSIAQLTDLGKEQALNLGRKLASKQLPIIYSSPFDRARQTAEYVASYNHTPIKILPDLREFSFGKAEGLSEEEAFQKYENEFDAVLTVADTSSYQVRIPEGESKEEALARFLNALEIIKQDCKYEEVGVATHGHIMSLYYYNRYHRVHHFENCELLEVEI